MFFFFNLEPFLLCFFWTSNAFQPSLESLVSHSTSVTQAFNFSAYLHIYPTHYSLSHFTYFFIFIFYILFLKREARLGQKSGQKNEEKKTTFQLTSKKERKRFLCQMQLQFFSSRGKGKFCFNIYVLSHKCLC